MYSKLIKPIVLLIALCIIIPSTESFGQNPNIKEYAKEIFSLVQKYIKSEVLPKMKEFKSELDNGLPKEDLIALNELRTQAKEFRSKILELRKELREAHRNGDGEKVDAKKDEIDELHERMLELIEKLKPIAEKNKDLLESIGDKVKPFVKEWKEDIKEIVKSWMQEHKSEFCNKKGEEFGKNFKKERMQNHFGLNMDKKRAIVRFLLWDGSEDFLNQFDENLNNFENRPVSKSKGFNCYNYPNPFNERTKFSFYLPDDEDVIISLSDISGKNLGDIYKGRLAKGDHIIYFEPNNSNFKNLLPGVYYYKIQAGKWNKSGKMIFGK